MSVAATTRVRRFGFIAVMGLLLAPGAAWAQLDKTSVEFQTPKDIKWVKNAAGTTEQAVLFGDPSKPGPYVMQIRWLPGNSSRPHFHPNDRFFVVVSGTWWVGTGDKYEPEKMVPMPAGSYVVHHAKGIHYDGAKDGEAVIQVWGMGPNTSTPAERK